MVGKLAQCHFDWDCILKLIQNTIESVTLEFVLPQSENSGRRSEADSFFIDFVIERSK